MSEGHSKLSIKDHASLILGLALRHNLSGECANDILKVISYHLPESNQSLRTINKVKQKLATVENNDLKCIEYCEICSAIWPDDENVTICKTEACKG